MALSKIQPASMDLTDNYAFTGTNFLSGAGDIEQTKLATLTASSSGTLDFTSSIDSTYNIYKFRFVNIHPAAESIFSFQADTGTNTSYNQTITSTYFRAYHSENDGDALLGYRTDNDLAQSTSFQHLSYYNGDDSDSGLNGELCIFDPSSTTFVKHFICNVNTMRENSSATVHSLVAGYFNTTTAITRFRFKQSSGNIDSGTIEMYGIN